MAEFLVNLISPAIVWVAAWLLSLAKKAIPDAVMSNIIIPMLAVASGYIQTVVVPDGAPFAVSVLLALVAVFLREFTKNGTRAALAWLKGEKLPRMGESENA